MSATCDRAAMQPARQQQMARLQAEEGDRLRRLDRRAHDRAGRAVDAARQVDGDDRHAGSRSPRRSSARAQPLDRPVEPGAEQRVDDEVAPRRAMSGDGLLDRPVQRRGGERRVALQPVARRRAAPTLTT